MNWFQNVSINLAACDSKDSVTNGSLKSWCLKKIQLSKNKQKPKPKPSLKPKTNLEPKTKTKTTLKPKTKKKSNNSQASQTVETPWALSKNLATWKAFTSRLRFH